MGVHDSYMETFTWCVVTTKEMKVRGSDHRGKFRFGHGWRDQVHLQYTMGEVDMSSSMAAGKLKDATEMSIGLSIRLECSQGVSQTPCNS